MFVCRNTYHDQRLTCNSWLDLVYRIVLVVREYSWNIIDFSCYYDCPPSVMYVILQHFSTRSTQSCPFPLSSRWLLRTKRMTKRKSTSCPSLTILNLQGPLHRPRRLCTNHYIATAATFGWPSGLNILGSQGSRQPTSLSLTSQRTRATRVLTNLSCTPLPSAADRIVDAIVFTTWEPNLLNH
jgi:hypothetical protein